MAIDPDLIDKLLAGYRKPEQIIGKEGLLKQLTKALLAEDRHGFVSFRDSTAVMQTK